MHSSSESWGGHCPLAPQLVVGVVLGIVIWALRLFVLSRFFQGSEVFTSIMPAGSWFFGFIAFGLVTAYFYDRMRDEETALT